MSTSKLAAMPAAKANPNGQEKKVTPGISTEAISNGSPLEDRILKVQKLSDLVQRRDLLEQSLKKLQSLKTSTESRDLKITIEDSANEWETFNTDAIKSCVEAMTTTIKGKIADLEIQIKW